MPVRFACEAGGVDGHDPAPTLETEEVVAGVRKMRLKTASDHSLRQRYRRGLDDAPTHLHLHYAERLRAPAARKRSSGLAALVDPEDVVQSVFRCFFRRAAEKWYDVPEGEEIRKLLLVIALNKIRALGNSHRAARRDLRRTVGGEAHDRARPR